MSKVAVRVFDFTLILAGLDDFSDEMADTLYELCCDDATFGTASGVHYGTFHREADSLAVAVASARQAVEAVGFQVARIEVDEAN